MTILSASHPQTFLLTTKCWIPHSLMGLGVLYHSFEHRCWLDDSRSSVLHTRPDEPSRLVLRSYLRPNTQEEVSTLRSSLSLCLFIIIACLSQALGGGICRCCTSGVEIPFILHADHVNLLVLSLITIHYRLFPTFLLLLCFSIHYTFDLHNQASLIPLHGHHYYSSLCPSLIKYSANKCFAFIVLSYTRIHTRIIN